MKRIIEVCPHIYQVGGNSLSDSQDCCVYLVEGDSESVLIDTGAGKSVSLIVDNMKHSGIDTDAIKYIIATHGHIDHIGGLKAMQERLQAQVVAHRLELPAIQEGLAHLTAASWYGVNYQKVTVDRVLNGVQETLQAGNMKLVCMHTPGHTQGGISVYVDTGGLRVLFGQDIHGPFNREWGSDLKQWRISMQALVNLKADILCEGHFGIYQPAVAVRDYIEGYLKRN
ncbi:MAG: Zn-dependent hydrolase [Firmicutes bacterium HGW-Firmicutes-15]|nr:MAG: Zn-dependent hydrolase [Firmicutes bacterium HGW-Firmicutes-15]